MYQSQYSASIFAYRVFIRFHNWIKLTKEAQEKLKTIALLDDTETYRFEVAIGSINEFRAILNTAGLKESLSS